MALCLDCLEVRAQYVQRVAMVSADFYHALFGLVELHALHHYAVNTCGGQSGDIRHNVLENLWHIRLYADDYSLHSARERFHDFQPLLVRWGSGFERVIFATYQAHLHNAVGLRQQVEIFRVYHKPPLCAYHEWVFGLRQQL